MAAETCRKCGGVKRDDPPMTATEREAVNNGWDLEAFRYAVDEMKRVRAQRGAEEPPPAPDFMGAIRRARNTASAEHDAPADDSDYPDLMSAIRAQGGAAKGRTR